jgi:hypothetical protein
VAKGNSKGIGGMMDFADFVVERWMEELDRKMVGIAMEDEKMPERKVDWLNRSDRGNLCVAYKTLSKVSNFREGDRVRLLRKPNNFELGWSAINHPEQSRYVGQIGEIIKLGTNESIEVEFEDGIRWCFPFFVLELVEPVSEKHTITIDGKSTEVDDKTYKKVKNLFE